MRAYSTILPAFWTGDTGRAITAAGKEARILATYLLSNEHANMLGLYRLPLLYAAEETGLKKREILDALEQLQTIGFAAYDQDTEHAWVLEMARFQMGLLPGEALKDGDKREKGSARHYKQLSSNPFLGPFFDHYATTLRLPLRRDYLQEKKPHRSPIKGAPEPLTRGYGPVLVPDLVRKGELGETTPDSLPGAVLTPECIRERWNLIPGVKPCKELGETIRQLIRTRLKQHPHDEWWNDLLHRVQDSAFLCGKTNGKDGSFQASLDWVLGPKNLDKIRAGNYDSMPPNGSVTPPTCTKRILENGSQHLRNCGQPASPESRPSEPRCCLHLSPTSQPEVMNYAIH